MTREQAQELLANVNGKIEMKRLDAVNLLLREIDELKIMEEDAQQYALKCRKELEALQQPKSCDDCKNRIFYTYDSFKQVTIDKCNIREQLHFNGSCDGLCCDKYESKEQ